MRGGMGAAAPAAAAYICPADKVQCTVSTLPISSLPSGLISKPCSSGGSSQLQSPPPLLLLPSPLLPPAPLLPLPLTSALQRAALRACVFLDSVCGAAATLQAAEQRAANIFSAVRQRKEPQASSRELRWRDKDVSTAEVEPAAWAWLPPTAGWGGERSARSRPAIELPARLQALRITCGRTSTGQRRSTGGQARRLDVQLKHGEGGAAGVAHQVRPQAHRGGAALEQRERVVWGAGARLELVAGKTHGGEAQAVRECGWAGTSRSSARCCRCPTQNRQSGTLLACP